MGGRCESFKIWGGLKLKNMGGGMKVLKYGGRFESFKIWGEV